MPTQFSAPPSNILPAFAQALGLHNGSVISIIGSGGKTTLMHSLARAYAAQHAVLCTATTKLWEPLPEESPFCLLPSLPQGTDFAAGPLARCFPNGAGRCTIASAYAEQPGTQGAGSPHPQAMLPNGAPRKKIIGYPPEMVDKWWPTVQATPAISSGPSPCASAPNILLVEADGSAGRPLKAHSPKEPLIPTTTQVVIAVVGLWGLGQPLHESTVWRPELFAERSGLSLGAEVTPRALAQAILHPQGLFSRAPSAAHTLLFLNGAETATGRALAQALTQELTRLMPQANTTATGNGLGFPVFTVFAGSARTLQGEWLCLRPS